MRKFKGFKKIPIENVDIRELLESEGLDYRNSGKNISSGWIGVNCPFCGDDHSNHLGINLRHKTTSCFRCGKTGTIITYLSHVLNSFNKAMSVIQKFIPRELRIEKEMERSGVSKVLLPDNAELGLSEYHKTYLRKRGFNPDILSHQFNMHSVGPVGKWKNRIILPVIRNYRLVTFTSIEIHDDSIIRYKHLDDESSIIPIKHLLFGEEFTDKRNVIVVEGIFDFFRFNGGVVPTFGTKFTDIQKKLLARFVNVTIVGDGDKAGWEMNKKLSAELSPFCNVKYYDLEEGLDPDKLTESEIRFIKGA